MSPAKTKVDANASSTERDFGGFDTLGCLLMMNGANVVQAHAAPNRLSMLISFSSPHLASLMPSTFTCVAKIQTTLLQLQQIV